MYDLPLNTKNKIVSMQDLDDFFGAMQKKLDELENEAAAEKMRNESLEYDQRIWELEGLYGRLTFEAKFMDGSELKFDGYRNFRNVFQTRYRTIQRIYAFYSASFSFKETPDMALKYISENIYITVDDSRLDISVSLSNERSRARAVYEEIGRKINMLPEKFDRLIKMKDLVSWKIGLAGGVAVMDVALIALLVTMIMNGSVREAIHHYIWAAPVVAIVFSAGLGIVFGLARTAKIYAQLIPNKKYGGYDSNTGKSFYNDDMKSFVDSAEVLIGEKADNMKLREELGNMETKAKYAVRRGGLVMLGLIVILALVWLIWK